MRVMEITMEFTMKMMEILVELRLWPQTVGACQGCQAGALVVVHQPIYRHLLNIPTHLVPSNAFGAHGNPLCRYFAKYRVVDCLSYAVGSRQWALCSKYCALVQCTSCWGWICPDWWSCCTLVHVAVPTLWHTVAHCGTKCATLWHTVAAGYAGKLGFPLVGASPPSTCMCWTSSINIITKWHQGAFQALPPADSNLLNVYRRRRHSINIYLPTGFGRILIICVESVMANMNTKHYCITQ